MDWLSNSIEKQNIIFGRNCTVNNNRITDIFYKCAAFILHYKYQRLVDHEKKGKCIVSERQSYVWILFMNSDKSIGVQENQIQRPIKRR